MEPQQRANLLISGPYQNWKDARAGILKHSTLKYHLHCLTSEAKTQIACNRQVLKSMIACLEFVVGRVFHFGVIEMTLLVIL